MRINEYNLGFVGFGHMAEIILKAFFSTKMILNSKVHFVRKDPKKAQ
jgi:pyrroline-5-carboxylate reductase